MVIEYAAHAPKDATDSENKGDNHLCGRCRKRGNPICDLANGRFSAHDRRLGRRLGEERDTAI